MQAIIIGHEIEHFDKPPTRKLNPQGKLAIESFCDLFGIAYLKDKTPYKSYATTLREIKYARAIYPIIETAFDKASTDRRPQSLYHHATALMLDEKSQNIFAEDDFACVARQACIDACEQIYANINDKESASFYLNWYVAAKTTIAQNTIPDQFTRRTIELFIEAAEYFSPDLARKALKKYRAQEHISEPQETRMQHDLSLEMF